MFSRFAWYRNARGGKWTKTLYRVKGGRIKARWERESDKAEVDEHWEGMSRPDLGQIDPWIPVSARLPGDGIHHPVKIRIKRSGAICFATARFHENKWVALTHVAPVQAFKVLAWMDTAGLIIAGHQQ